MGHPVLWENSIFHCPNSDLLGNVALFVIAQLRVLFLDDFARALARFLEKLTQRDVLAGSCLHQFTILTEDAAKRDVAQISRVTFASRDLENLFEMQDLRRANYVPNRVGFQIVHPVIDCCEIRRGIIKAAVPFPDDQRFIGQFGIFSKENNNGALADLSNARFKQAFDHAEQAIVVKTFAALDVVMDIQQLVNALEILHGEGDTFVPDVEIFLVARLEFYQLLAAGFANSRVLGCSLVRFLVNAHYFCERIALQRLSIEQILPAVNHHPELRAPVADVIVANHFESEKLRDARKSIAKHRAADVPDMHWFGDIGRSKINHDTLCRFCVSDTEPVVPQHFHCLFSDGGGPQRKVDEACARHCRWFAKIVSSKMRDDFLRENSWIFIALLPENESSVGLVIAEARIACQR